MPEPRDKKLYKKVKSLADKKFNSRSGIYRSSWIVREYKRRGGTYKGSRTKTTGLTRWFSEKWVDLNRPVRNSRNKTVGYEPCGRKESAGKYPLCRPTRRVTSQTPKTWKELSSKAITQAKRDKEKVKGRSNITFGKQHGGGQESTRVFYFGDDSLTDMFKHFNLGSN
jgi:hypothetical protein